MKDITCLAEGSIYFADSSLIGLNLNELIMGVSATSMKKTAENIPEVKAIINELLSKHTGKSRRRLTRRPLSTTSRTQRRR